MRDLLGRTSAVGLKLTARGEQLHVEGPKNVVREQSLLIAQLKQHKNELLALLKKGGRQELFFEVVYVGRDPWIVGTRLDKPGQFVFWFAKSRVRNWSAKD